MILAAAFAGLIIGWAVNWLSDYLPRFAYSPQVSNQNSWKNLHFGAETLSAVFFAYLWVQTNTLQDFCLIVGIYSFLLLIAIIDFKYRLILNVLIYPAIVAVFVYQIAYSSQPLDRVLLGGGMVLMIFLLAASLGDLGGGDIKLATLFGIAFGFPQVLWVLLVGAGAGALVAVILLMTRYGSRKSHMPYAPFLCLGAMVALLYQPIQMFAV